MPMSALDGLHSRLTGMKATAVVPDIVAGLSVGKLAVLDERASHAAKGRSVNPDKAVQRTLEALDKIEARLEHELESAFTYGGTEFGYQSGIAGAIRCVLEVREEFCDEAVELNAA